MLVRRGADVDKAGKDCRSPLWIAARVKVTFVDFIL